ncbi:hypothetical protein CHS0354_032114 [Potamilus streckersoni]|uniref:Uncharacterized protein n=1 Tax=Potamilus streckersoni TaxID=2493646 RepID=A0AAE0TB67_9BIVA|nr:hypothetical protein CHS0354_032114 [Potamilus streckersoni]
MCGHMLLPDNLKLNHFVTILKLQSEIEVVDLNNSNSSNKNGETEISISLADLHKSSINPLNSTADADRTEKNNHTKNDSVILTEEDGNEDNPAKAGLDVGKFLDSSKVVNLIFRMLLRNKIPRG